MPNWSRMHGQSPPVPEEDYWIPGLRYLSANVALLREPRVSPVDSTEAGATGPVKRRPDYSRDSCRMGLTPNAGIWSSAALRVV